MKWNVVFGMIVAVGSLTATAARAQDNAAGSATQAQAATSDTAPDAIDFTQPFTVDANGDPVAKPNPMSDFLERAREDGTNPVAMPLLDDYRTDGSATGGQTK